MNNINIFENNEFGKIRTVKSDNEVWFFVQEICEKIDIQNSAVSRFGIDELDIRKMYIPELSNNYTVVNESGLYTLILRSNKPEAKRFKRWVTSEVLPSIHKHGAYMTPDTIEKVLLNPDTIINLATQLKHEQEERRRIELELKEAEPKILHSNAVTASDDCISMGQLADILNQNGIDTGQNRLFDWMREHGYIEKRTHYRINSKGERVKEKSKTPTQRAMDLGLFNVQQTAKITPEGVKTFFTTKVTGKGQQYFIDKFLKQEVQA